jgi:hypothetical protein
MIRHLHDVAGLEPLEKIAHDQGVDLVAHGGLARRLFTLAVREPSVSAPDLFDLLPFTADIDLTHTGGRDATKAIMEAIRREVPLAECFRWELRSAEEEIDARLSRPYGPVVPVHGVTLGVRAGFDDPMNARADVAASRHRYVRNPAYRDSPRFLAGRDLEVFGAIRYLRTVLEDGAMDSLDAKTQDDVRATFQEAMSLDTLGRLQESVFLRTRLHALLKSLAVELRTRAARAMVDVTLLRAFVAYVDGEPAPGEPTTQPPGAVSSPAPRSVRPAPFRHDLQLDSNSAIVASEHIRGDLFRLAPRMPLMWPIVPPATAGSLSPLQIVRDPAFQAPGVAVLRVSAWVPVVPGKAAPSYDADGEANEMIHLAFLADGDPGNAPTPPRDEDFGMTMLLKRGIAPSVVQAASPLASCVSRPYERDDGGMITVRCFRAACGSLIEQMLQDDEEGTLSLAFVIAARSVEEQEPDVAWLAPLTLVARDDFDEQLVGAT